MTTSNNTKTETVTLTGGRELAIVWDIDDIQERCPCLTDQEAWEVLRVLVRATKNDPDLGELICGIADDLYPGHDDRECE